MGKRRNQRMIDSDSDSNNDSGSDLDSVSFFLVFSTFAYSIFSMFRKFIRQLKTRIISKTDDAIYFREVYRNGIKDNSKIPISFHSVKSGILVSCQEEKEANER